jgi:hypothetical protein
MSLFINELYLKEKTLPFLAHSNLVRNFIHVLGTELTEQCAEKCAITVRFICHSAPIPAVYDH